MLEHVDRIYDKLGQVDGIYDVLPPPLGPRGYRKQQPEEERDGGIPGMPELPAQCSPSLSPTTIKTDGKSVRKQSRRKEKEDKKQAKINLKTTSAVQTCGQDSTPKVPADFAAAVQHDDEMIVERPQQSLARASSKREAKARLAAAKQQDKEQKSARKEKQMEDNAKRKTSRKGK